MATPTYTLIDSTTLGSSAASVTFSSIPAGGDLVIVMSGQTTDGSNCTQIQAQITLMYICAEMEAQLFQLVQILRVLIMSVT